MSMLCVPITMLDDPVVLASTDVGNYAASLARAAHELPEKYHALALDLLHGSRIYCFERNGERWPDGLFYMLNLSYSHWHGHRIGFTQAQLMTFGVLAWDELAITDASEPDVCPMETTRFRRDPRGYLAHYAALVGRIADELHARAQARINDKVKSRKGERLPLRLRLDDIN